MRRVLLLIAFAAMVNGAMAVPARGNRVTVRQSDGTSLTVTLWGDESFHYYKTDDGVPLVLDDNGDYCYASAVGFGLMSSGVIAHEASLRTAAETASVQTLESVEAQRRYAPRSNRSAKRQPITRKAISLGEGNEKRGLVIMVEFSDQDFDSDASHDVWNDILNKEGYNENGANGSVHDYFKAQSNGAFNLKFDLAGPVKMPKSRYYYGKDRVADVDIDMNVGELVAEACKAVDGQVDFSTYDWDADGEVEQIYILYAGWGQAVTGADSRLIWPHEYQLEAYPAYPKGINLDGVKINTYACGAEKEGLESNSTMLTGLGTFCHEFSHCLGLPDFYTYNGLDMLGYWDLMSYGCYNNDGWCPAGYTSYEKEFCGWQSAKVLNSPTTVTEMKAQSESGQAYKVVNECTSGDVDEYYLLENRQQTGWDKYVPGHGLLVLHVDYDEYTWENNTVNDDSSHPRMTVIPATGLLVPLYGMDKMTYPLAGDNKYKDNNELTDTSKPAATVFNVNKNGTKYMGKPITEITETDGKISFKFCGGSGADGITAVGTDNTDGLLMGQPVSIYNTAGGCVAVKDSYDGLAGLPAGVYVVKGGNGHTVKVIKK